MDTTTKGTRTKYRLAEAMKECMKTTPVDNITVTQLTELCGVTPIIKLQQVAELLDRS